MTTGKVSKLFRAYELYNEEYAGVKSRYLVVSKLFRAYELYNASSNEILSGVGHGFKALSSLRVI